MFAGNNYYFTGVEILSIWFGSLELPFGSFYKIQVSPFFQKNLKNLWPWGDYENNVVFNFAEPYFEDVMESFGTTSVRMFVKYTNDNNPFSEAIITPSTYTDGLAKVGGYAALFGILKIALFFYNKKSFEKDL